MAEPPTLPGRLRRAAAAEPGRVAVAVEDGGALTYGSWEERSDSQAHGLGRAGVRPGDRVALVFDAARWTDYAVSYLAVLKAAAVAVPLRAGLTEVELGAVLGDCEASALVAPELVPPATSAPILSPGELEAGGVGPAPAASVRGSTLAEILYAPRPLCAPVGVLRSHRFLLGGPVLRFDPAPPSLLHCFPVGTHAGQDALGASLGATPVCPVVLPGFDPDRLCALLEAGPARACCLHPASAQALLDSGAADRHDVSRVTGLVLASGWPSSPLLGGLGTAFPRAALVAVDVLGGALGVRSVFTHDRSRPGSVGRPSAGTAVLVVDDAGQPVGSGEVGQVRVRDRRAGPERPDDGSEEEAQGEDGIATGEHGYLDDAGFLYLVGARHDVSRRGRSTVSRLEASTSMRETVTAVWERVLGRRDVGPEEDFFELGGDCFAATAVLQLLEDVVEARVALPTFLAAPTVAGLAAAVEGLAPGPGPPAPATVAFSQEGMLWHECFAPGSQNLPGLGRRYRGPLDVEALGRALDEIVRRQGALRTTFALRHGRPAQVVHRHRPRDLPVRDLGDRPPEEREAEVQRLVAEAGRRPFDLVAGPLFEPTLLRVGAEDHVLVIRTHHSVFDDWSVGVFRRELAALYAAYAGGEASPLSELSVPFADFSRRRRRLLAGPAGARELAFWRRELGGAPFTTQLPVDDPSRPEGSSQAAGEPVSLGLPAELRDGLGALARRERATIFMTVLAAFGVLVQRYTGQDDLLLATVVANRNRTELEGVIGCFTKKVPLRLRLSGDPTFTEALARTRAALLGALAHQDLPFEAVIQDTLGAPAAAHGLAPHAAVMFQGVTPRQELSLPGVETAGLETSTTARRAHHMAAGEEEGGGEVPALPWGAGLYLGTFVILSLIESPDELACVARGAFHGPAVDELLKSLRVLLADVVADPARPVSELAVLDRHGRARMLERGRGPVARVPPGTVPDAFAAQVRRDPDAVAVSARGEAVTYAELDARSDRLAERLRALGAGPRAPVGIALAPSTEAVMAALATWKAGAAWVGLDPADAEERLAGIVADASLAIVVGDPGCAAVADHIGVVGAEADGDHGSTAGRAPVAAAPDDTAVVFYGSGPSAVPRGVVLDHRSVLSLMAGLRDGVHRGPGATALGRRVCLSAAPTQEGFLRQLVALLDGHRLHARARSLHADPRGPVSLLAGGEVDVLDCTPDELDALLDAGLGEALAAREPELIEPVLVVGTRGAVGPELWRTLRGLPAVSAHVLYGPPECAFGATIRAVAGTSTPRGVGGSMAGVGSHVLDAPGRPVPTRAVGELHLEGPSLARGYLGDPEATRGRFVERRLEGRSTRLHRTRQLARALPDGGVELLGPLDGDGDLRGFRVDVGRVRSALAGCPGVRDTSVALEPGERGDRRLVARILAEGPPPTLARLRAFLWSRLPGYAWPSALLPTERPSGEGERDVEAAGRREQPFAEGGPHEPGPEQGVLGALWAEALGCERVPPGANYWQAFSFLEALAGAREAGVSVPVERVTTNRTIATLATALAAARNGPRRARFP